MKLGVLSDTHDQWERTSRAVDELQARGASALFHCGDLTSAALARVVCRLPAHVALGNNDHDAAGISRAVRRFGGTCVGLGGEVVVGGKRIALTHGHSTPELARLLAAGPDFLFRGHSHRKGIWREGATTVVNPGALHRATPWTVALVDLATDQVELVVIEDGP